MIDISNINNRKNKLLQENNIQIRNIDYDLFKEKPNKYFLEKCLKGWKSLHENESMALVKTMSLFSSFMESDINVVDKNRAINILTEEVIPSIDNIKDSKKVFKKYNSKSWYSSINECIDLNIECNTILNNQKKLNKSINLESRFVMCRNQDSIINTINEVCNDIKQIKVPMMVRYNVALENVNYTINKLGLSKFIKREEIFESVTDNFLIDNFEDDYQLYYLNKALQENSMFKDMDYFAEGKTISKFKENGANIAKKLTKDFMAIPNKTPEGVKKVIRAFYAKSENNILEGTPNILIWIRHMVTFSTLALSIPFGAIVLFTDNFIALHVKKSEITKMVNKYQKEMDKVKEQIKNAKDDKKKERLTQYKNKLQESLDKLKEYRDTVMSSRERDEIDKKENGFGDDVSFESTIEDDFKQMCLIEYTRMLMENYNELKHDEIITEGVYNNCLIYPYSSVMNGIVKLTEYGIIDKNAILESLLSAKDDIYKTSIILESGTYDSIINDIKERKIERAKKKIIKLSEGQKPFYKIINLINTVILGTVAITALATGLVLFMVSILTAKLCDTINLSNEKDLYKLRKILNKRKKIIEVSKDEDSKEYMNEIDSCIKLIDEVLKDKKKNKGNKNLLKENVYESLASKFCDLDNLNTAINGINNIQQVQEVSSLDDIIEVNRIMENVIQSEQNCILEMKFKNSAKLYANKVKNKVQQVKDKDHQVSSNLDNAVENFMTNKKRAMENKARETVVKGTVIPSASKVIKLALAGAITAAVIHPAVTVVAALGAIALNKKATAKERKYILDEIEVQKEIVDKKLQIAENNNDIKATEELLKLQKQLKKEEQRIKYKMSDRILVVHGNND